MLIHPSIKFIWNVFYMQSTSTCSELSFPKSLNSPNVTNAKQPTSPLQLSNESVRATSAIRALMRDLKEIEKNPLPLVSALPLEDNMFIWHCNLKGPGTYFFSLCLN
jgi:hypothetical protein